MESVGVTVLVRLKDAASAAMRSMGKTGTSVASNLKNSFAGIGRQYMNIRFAVLDLANGLKSLGRTVSYYTGLAGAQELAEAGLASALKTHNQYTEEAVAQTAAYASQIQMLIGVGDEELIAVAAKVEAYTGMAKDTMPQVMKAAASLAKMTGQDLPAAGMMLAKSLKGSVNLLARVGIEFDVTASKEAKLEAITQQTVAGWNMAIAEANTYSGAVNILGTVWGDYHEALGRAITQSPAVLTMIKELTRAVVNQTGAIDSNREHAVSMVDTVVRSVSQGITNTLKFITYFVTGFKIIGIAFRQLGDSVIIGVSTIINLVLSMSKGAVNAAYAVISTFHTLWGTVIDAIFKLPGVAEAWAVKLNAVIAPDWTGVDKIIESNKKSIGVAADSFNQYSALINNLGMDANAFIMQIEGVNNAIQSSKGVVDPSTTALNNQAEALDNVAKSAKEAKKNIITLNEAELAVVKAPWTTPAKGVQRGSALDASQVKELAKGFTVSRAFADMIPTLTQAELNESMKYLGEDFVELSEVVEKTSISIENLGRVSERFDPGKWYNFNQTGGARALQMGRERMQTTDFGSQLAGAIMGGRDSMAGLVGSMGGQFIGDMMRGTTGGVLGGLLGGLGSFASPFIGLVSGMMGGFIEKWISKSKFGKPEGTAKPVDVRVINLGDMAMMMLQATKHLRVANAAAGVRSIDTNINRQALRAGYAM